MTTGTIGLIRGVLPGNDFRVALVAIRAQEVATMILWLVRQRRMSVIRRCPRIGAMTHVALLCGAEVVLILAGRLDAIVAGGARPEDLGMIYRQDRRKHIGRMTVFAHICCLYMCRILARCICAVMAADTIARNINVIEIRR